MVGNHDIPAAGIPGGKFVAAEPPHMHHDIALRFDNVIRPADNLIGIMRPYIVARIDKMCALRAKEADPFFEPADDAGVVARPARHFFRPLEVDDVISLVRFPEFLC